MGAVVDTSKRVPDSARAVWLCVAYAVAHVLAHGSARWFEVTPGIAIWYVPGGLALALLTLLGPRYMPLVLVMNLATAWLPTPPVAMWMVWFFPCLITVGYGAAAWLVRRFMDGVLLPGTPRQTLGFCLVTGLAPMLVATAGTAVYYWMSEAGHAPAGEEFWASVTSWWIGDASGILTVVPVIMVFAGPWLTGAAPAIDWRRMTTEQVIMAITRAVLLVATIVVVLTLPVLREHDAFYICFLPLIWICVHHGLPGATLATLLIMITGLVSMRLTGTSVEFSYVFLLFELAVSSVGLGLGTMVTRRNDAERKLAASREQLNHVIVGAQLGLWDWHMDGDRSRVDINERFAAMLGYRREEIVPFRSHWEAMIHPADAARLGAAMAAHIEGRTELFEAEFRMKKKDGHWCWLHSRGSAVLRDGAGRPLRVSGTQVDVTDRKRAESEVSRLLRIIEVTPDLIVTTDEEGRVVYANAALLAVCGRGGPGAFAPGKRLSELLTGEAGLRLVREALPAALTAGRWQGESTIIDTTGREIPTSQVVLAHHDEESDTFAFSVIMRDLTDQKRAESEQRQRDRELLQLQKAESLGVMAGGIAHDFNNLLTSVMGNANLAGFGLPAGSPVLGHLAKIEESATRAAALCQQMLAYAGRNPVSFTEIDLNRFVQEACRLLEPGIRKTITVRLELAKSPAPVLAASTQMQQVVMNLVLNAAESIGANEGEVTVRTSECVYDEAGLRREFPRHFGVAGAAGAYVVLEVADTGCGIAADMQARIFEPFFTTKFTGQGLGLAAVAGVVKSHRGAITVLSAPGRGSVFRLAFPALVKKPAAASGAGEAVRNGVADTWRGGGTILVVDDDAVINDVAAQILRSFGYQTLTARDGAEAVELFRRHANELAGVLLDLTMPKMDGFAAHAEMHKINPGVPVILMSGFSGKLDHLPPEAIHPAGVLAKPFGRTQLRERVAAVFGKREG